MSAGFGFAPEWPAPPNVRARVTERGSAARYGTMNLALHVGDDAAAVAANRARLRAGLELPSEPHWLEQVHGVRVLDLDREEGLQADGAVTSRAGVVCVVMTADCLPVVLCDRDGRRVGVVHAGWRGLLNGVLPAAVAALGDDPEGLLAWLGPAIGQAAFEVGAEVRDAFVAGSATASRRFSPNQRGRWQADLYGLARDSLAAAGVRSVHGGGFCTYTEADRFFSHRREAPCGRMAALVWLDPAR
ncbi:MAG TPA: peptidoglycan editing factor PgeF [Gammaproteobacteria bacterium]|nr:peptidoglycan editing factor PgeF [Gammaproteobacteria bacterium]